MGETVLCRLLCRFPAFDVIRQGIAEPSDRFFLGPSGCLQDAAESAGTPQ